MGMKKYDIYCGLFWFALASFVFGASLLWYGFGNLSYPAPGFYPFLISSFLLCLSLIMIIGALWYGKKNPDFTEWPSFGRNVPLTMAVLLAYAFSLEFLGYLVGSSLLLLFLFKVVAARRWWVSILMTAIVAFISYGFFVVLLKSQLPKGILG